MFKMIMALTWLAIGTANATTTGVDYGNPKANRKGTIYLVMSSEPETLNPYKSTDAYGSEVFSFVFSTLITRDPETYDFAPNLAESWEITNNGLTFTFKLREGATFSDGKPIRAEDVKFTFDSIRNPEYGAAHLVPYFENLKEVKVIDSRTVQMTTSQVYFKNLEMLGMQEILPEHIYKDPKAKTNKTAIGSGPYVLEKYDKSRSIELKRNDKWFGRSVTNLQSMHNYERVLIRFAKQEDVILEMMKKGEVDYESGMTNEAFVKKMVGKGWEKIKKFKVETKIPKGYGYIGLNLKKPVFTDVRVRKALVHLMNRRLMNEKFRFNMSDLQAGPIYGRSPYASPKIQPLEFDVKKASELLKEAGWEDQDKNGILEKSIDGKKVELRFTLFNVNPDFEKYLTLYKEDLKKAGVELSIKLVEWNSLMKAVDEKNFDAVAMAWTGVVEYDPKQIWHSSSMRKGGSNYISYSNPEVDKLIDEVRQIMDVRKRIDKMHKITELIAADVPYIFMFSERYDKYAHNERIEKVKESFNYSLGFDYTWIK